MQRPFRAHWEAPLPPCRRGARPCHGATQQHLPPAATGGHTRVEDAVAQPVLMILVKLLPAQEEHCGYMFPPPGARRDRVSKWRLIPFVICDPGHCSFNDESSNIARRHHKV